MNTLAHLIQEFEVIDKYMKAVRDIVQDGHLPDMRGLDERVSNLCTAIQNAPPETQQRCLPRLSELLQKLDICESDLRSYHDARLSKGKAQ